MLIRETNDNVLSKNDLGNNIYEMAQEMTYGDSDDYLYELFDFYNINIYDYENYDEVFDNTDYDILNEIYIKVSNKYIMWLINEADDENDMLNSFTEYINVWIDITDSDGFHLAANSDLKKNVQLIGDYLRKVKQILDKSFKS